MNSPKKQLYLFITSILNHSKWDKAYTQKKWGLQLEAIEFVACGQMLMEVVKVRDAFAFIQQEIWIFDQTYSQSFAVEIKNDFLARLLKSIDFSHYVNMFCDLDSDQVKQTLKLLAVIEDSLIDKIKSARLLQRRSIVGDVLQTMEVLFQKESNLSHEKMGTRKTISYYRSFDFLDEFFELNYEADQKLFKAPHESERLYEGAGEGVQSSYSTLFSLLRAVNMPDGTKFIDLGSGYGRVGLIIGLLRPEIEFTGYEYESHRVDVANNSVRLMGLENKVEFLTQDLALEAFQIPVADIYYLYDPFSENTYRKVLLQLIEISKSRSITIATKGNAKQWLQKIAVAEGWSITEDVNGDNLCLYRS